MPPSKKKSASRRPPWAHQKRRPATRKTRARRRARSPLSWLCLWPLILLQRFTAGFPFWLRWPLHLAAIAALVCVPILLLVGIFYSARAMNYDLDGVKKMPERTIVLDRHGVELGRIHGENRDIITIDQVPNDFKNAILAREDANFYEHHGIDLRGLARAVVENIKRRRFAQGASTLTMQLAKNSFLEFGSHTSTWEKLDRKLLEIPLSFRLESHFSKDEILQHYLNRIFWGHSIRGLQAASIAYFEKPVSQINLSESALLAGIIRSPNTFSPFRSLKKAKRERDVVLSRMVHYKYITKQQAEAAKKTTLHIRPSHRRTMQNTYAMDAVRRKLDVILAEKNIALGGLTIKTTIDQTLQLAAERAIDNHLRSIERLNGYHHQTRSTWQTRYSNTTPKYLQGVLVAIENKTGAVLAVAGGRSAEESKYNRALHAHRPIGSIFKPFVYLTAFNRGLLPDTLISDKKIQPGEIDHAPRNWSPSNSDGKFLSLITCRKALAKSRNTSSVRVGDYAGIKHVIETARLAGFYNDKERKRKRGPRIPPYPASYLGTWEATPWDVASAYTIFPNHGIRYRPYLIEEIRNTKIADPKQQVPYRTGQIPYRAAKRGVSWAISSILQETAKSGTASAIKSRYGFRKPVGGKTGTTNNYHDAWFAGYTSSITVAVWVGFDRPKRIINKGYGSRLALPIWADFMKIADRIPKYRASTLSSSDISFTKVNLCRLTGQYATPGCQDADSSYQDSIPNDMLPRKNDFCPIHPLRAKRVSQPEISPTRPQRSPPRRALPVEEERRPSPPRALPVE